MPEPQIVFASSERLAALRLIADDANRQARDRGQEARAIAENLTTARQRLAGLRGVRPGFVVEPASRPADGVVRRLPLDAEAAPVHRTWQPSDLSAEITAAEGRVRDLEAALETARFEADDASARWTAASRLYDACLRFAQDNNLPLPVAIHQVGTDRHAGAAVHAEVR